MKIALAFAVCLLLAACNRVPDLDEAAVEAILADARLILDNAPIGAVEPSAWPASFAQLSAKAVRVTEEGLFIVTYSFFVEESGVFVVRDLAKFEWGTGYDPEFRRIRDGLFEYHFTG